MPLLPQIKLLFGPLVIQLLWYNTKRIIYLSVGESSGYLLSPLGEQLLIIVFLHRPYGGF